MLLLSLRLNNLDSIQQHPALLKAPLYDFELPSGKVGKYVKQSSRLKALILVLLK